LGYDRVPPGAVVSGGPADPDTDAVLDVVALIEARLRHDEAAFAYLLDHGDNRRQAYLLAGDG